MNQADLNGSTPLWMAAKEGNDVVVKLLIDGGADVNHVVQGAESWAFLCASRVLSH